MTVVMMVVVVVPMVMSAAMIGTGFGLESRIQTGDAAMQPFNHLLKHVILLQAQPVRPDLNRHMPIPQMVGNRSQRSRIIRLNLGQRFGRGIDA